jgi:hypothetical protein
MGRLGACSERLGCASGQEVTTDMGLLTDGVDQRPGWPASAPEWTSAPRSTSQTSLAP